MPVYSFLSGRNTDSDSDSNNSTVVDGRFLNMYNDSDSESSDGHYMEVNHMENDTNRNIPNHDSDMSMSDDSDSDLSDIDHVNDVNGSVTNVPKNGETLEISEDDKDNEDDDSSTVSENSLMNLSEKNLFLIDKNSSEFKRIHFDFDEQNQNSKLFEENIKNDKFIGNIISTLDNKYNSKNILMIKIVNKFNIDFKTVKPSMIMFSLSTEPDGNGLKPYLLYNDSEKIYVMHNDKSLFNKELNLSVPFTSHMLEKSVAIINKRTMLIKISKKGQFVFFLGINCKIMLHLPDDPYVCVNDIPIHFSFDKPNIIEYPDFCVL